MSSNHRLKKTILDTPLGSMIAIADDHTLYLLEFTDCRGLDREIKNLQKKAQSEITSGRTASLELIKEELKQYFAGQLKQFKTPLFLLGTEFQKNVWQELQKIPYGETRSYAEIAKKIEKPTAYRAVAQANGSNQLAIIVPCHRVINTGGKLGGYAGGLSRKEHLLNIEKQRI